MPNLKQYLSESELTDDLKGAYTKQSDNRYKLNDLSDDHSLIVAQKEVNDKANERQNQINGLTTDKANLERERDELKSKSLPTGYRAVKKEDADLIEKIKAVGLTETEIGTLKTENNAFKAKEAQAAERESKTKAFKFAEVTETGIEKAFQLNPTKDLKIEWKTVDGVEKPYVVTEKDGRTTETLFDKKYLSETEGFKGFDLVLFGKETEKKGFKFGSEGGEGDTKSAADKYIGSTYKVPEKKN